jgi:hypothetical protein
MGTEAIWIPIALAAAGAGVNQVNTNRTAKKRDRDIAQGIRDSSAQQQKADSAINENLDELSESRAAPFKDKLQDSFIQRIRANQALGTDNIDSVGGTSDAFKRGSTKAKTGAIDYAGVIADLLSSVDAAGNQRTAERKSSNNTGMDLLKFKRNSEQDSFLAQMRAARHRDNPLLAILGAGLSGAAVGGGFGGGGGVPAAAPIAAGSGVTPGSFNTGLGLDKLAEPYRGLPGRVPGT